MTTPNGAPETPAERIQQGVAAAFAQPLTDTSTLQTAHAGGDTIELHGLNECIMGASGSGKTYAIGTMIEAGLEVFYVGMEPGLETLFGYFTDKGKPIPPNFHWHMVESAKSSFLEMMDIAKKINTMTFESVSKLQDPNRSKFTTFYNLLSTLNNFVDDRTGKAYGPVDSWNTDRCLVIDGLTGVNNAAMATVVGGKPVRNMSDWGVAQNLVEGLLRKLCEGSMCHFCLLAHVERETDTIQGGSKITISTLGKALAPKIPAMFSDVILAVREGDKFRWDTASALADTKFRNLPLSPNNLPDFRPILAKWKSRGGVITPTTTPVV